MIVDNPLFKKYSASYDPLLSRDTGGDGIRPLAVLLALELLGTPETQSRVTGERDGLSDGVVELDDRHSAADRGSRVRTGLGTWKGFN